MRFKLFLLILILSCASTAFAGTISFDQLAISSDLTATKYNGDLNKVYQKVNTNIQGDNVANDTLLEANMSDEINPRVRTAEGAACAFVYSGLIPASAAGTLTSNISSGVGYPGGYRINKSSATAHTYTASRWTYVYLGWDGDFDFSEKNIGISADPTPSDHLLLARVSTDETQVLNVEDLRTTTCSDGPFENIVDVSGEASLEDLTTNGIWGRRFSMAGRTPKGIALGANISWDGVTSFKVTAGSLYINGFYRSVSTDITVPTTVASPTTGTSGIDAGGIGASTLYYVYAVADQSNVKTFSISYSSNATTPTNATNFRLLGIIRTDATSLFCSDDIVTAHTISEKEIPSAWCVLNSTPTVPEIHSSFNISGITDRGTGEVTFILRSPMNSTDYVVVGNADAGTEGHLKIKKTGYTFFSVDQVISTSGAGNDGYFYVMAIGDNRK